MHMHERLGADLHSGAPAPLRRPRRTSDREVISAEADHRIANHLALLVAQVRLKAADLDRQGADPSRESVDLLLSGLGVQIDAVARLHRALVSGGPPAPTTLAERLHGICEPFASGISGKTEIIEDFAPDCIVRADQALALSQIVAEVLTNAIKHGSGGSKAHTIMVCCSNTVEGDVRIEVIDNGPGLPDSFDPATAGGLGFRLVKALGKQLGAVLEYQSSPRGLRFQLTLPRIRPCAPTTMS